MEIEKSKMSFTWDDNSSGHNREFYLVVNGHAPVGCGAIVRGWPSSVWVMLWWVAGTRRAVQSTFSSFEDAALAAQERWVAFDAARRLGATGVS